MLHYSDNIIDRIADDLEENLEGINVTLTASQILWLASSVYSELEDEFRGPA